MEIGKSGHNRDVDGIIEKVIQINRVNKVTKGGKRLAFRAAVVVGNNSGQVMIGLGKSTEVPAAIKKAIERGRKHLQHVTIVNNTISHEVIGQFGGSRVLLRPAKEGTGVIAGGAVRIVLELAGIHNVVAKSLGAASKINNAFAVINALSKLRTGEEIFALRDKKFEAKRGLDV